MQPSALCQVQVETRHKACAYGDVTGAVSHELAVPAGIGGLGLTGRCAVPWGKLGCKVSGQRC